MRDKRLETEISDNQDDDEMSGTSQDNHEIARGLSGKQKCSEADSEQSGENRRGP
jgi:hypothetical protein